MTQEGRITYEQFTSACSNFIKIPQARADLWKLEDSYEFGECFLSMSTIRRVGLQTSALDSYDNILSQELITDLLENEEGEQTDFQLLQYRFDILYSVSHCVPVLYFTISETSGRVLGLNEVWKLLGLKVGSKEQRDSLWNIVSLLDHPILHTPFLCVHPCNNWAVIKDCFQGENPSCLQFLISWMSIVGNQFGLQLSPSYLQNISGDKSHSMYNPAN